MKIIRQGRCTTRNKDYNQPFVDFGGRLNPRLQDCPFCRKWGTCDMWEAEVDDDWQREPPPPPPWSKAKAASSIHGAGHAPSDVNTFPGTTASAHKEVLFIFLDDPLISAQEVYDYVHYRIREHIRGNPTEELRLVTEDEDSLLNFFGWNVNRRVNALIKQWREIEPSFAPMISFEDHSGEKI